MDKTLNQMVEELNQKTAEADDLAKEIAEVVRPGTILKLNEPLTFNYEERSDKDLTEEDFRYAVIVAVPGHGFSLMDIEGHLIKLFTEGEMVGAGEMDDNPADPGCELDYDDPVSLVVSYPGSIVGHISDYMQRFMRGL